MTRQWILDFGQWEVDSEKPPAASRRINIPLHAERTRQQNYISTNNK